MKNSGAKKTKSPVHEPQSTKSENAKLRLIKGGNSQPDPSMKVVAFFLIFATLVFTTIIYFSSSNKAQLDFPEGVFSQLPEIYTKQGLDKFLENKAVLKDWVTEALKHPERKTQWNFARNVSVYLFPESLSGEDFERDVALKQWYPLELAIEKGGKDPENRIRFEDLRADIWNYENPDREHPQLTIYASQVIRIYDALSSP
jgi:hypothetical protein